MYKREIITIFETYYKKEGLKTEERAKAYAKKCIDNGGRCERVLVKHDTTTDTYTVIL